MMIVVDLRHPALADTTGRGVSVAVVDSGVNPQHHHIGGLVGGVAIGEDGELSDDFVDAVGHGTAVAAAIHEKAPDAQLYAVRVFSRSLAANADCLARAIDWAAEQGARVINLSLGTANPEREPLLKAAVERATARGRLIVSACEYPGRRWLPGSLPGTVAAVVDWDCPRDEMRLTRDPSGRTVCCASGYPRPIPGVPPERNLKGLSFAVANVSGFLARLVQVNPELRRAEDVLNLLK